MNTLYLASTSPSRQILLKQAQIPFKLLLQSADESACDWALPLQELVLSIALHKMEHAQMPEGQEGDEIFVLTADTLSQNNGSKIEGKPVDKEDAIRKIKAARNGTKLCSAFCLDKNQFQDGAWKIVDRVHQAVCSEYQFIIPDEWLDTYLESSVCMGCSNAIAIEGYGEQFLKEIRGSYSAIVGLPMFELREALSKLDFFS